MRRFLDEVWLRKINIDNRNRTVMMKQSIHSVKHT